MRIFSGGPTIDIKFPDKKYDAYLKKFGLPPDGKPDLLTVKLCAKLLQHVEPVNPPAVWLGDILQHAVYFPELVRGVENTSTAIDFIAYLRDVWDFYEKNKDKITQ